MTVSLAYPDAVGGVEPAAEKNEILAGQAHNFRRQLLVIGMVKAVNAGLLGGVFYAYVNPYLLSAWIVAVWYLAFLCIRSWWRHRDRIDETAPKPGYIERAIRSTYVSGILWGVGAAILFLPESIPHQLFLVFLIGGMAAGTTAGLSTLPNAWIGYVLPSMLPLVASLAIVGESIQLGMAGLLLVYTAALFWMSRFNYATFVSGVRSRMRIAELAREVEESRTKLDDAISSISDGFILFDADDKIVTCNEQFRKLYNFVADLCVPGMSFERVCRAAAWRLDVADTDYGKDDWVQRRVALHRNARDSSDIELGDGRWVRVSERRTADGGIVGVHTDITEKRQAEEALRESEQRLQSLAENLPGFVFQRHLKTDGSIEHPFVSAGVKEIYGITAEDAVANSRTFLDTVHPADRDALMAAVQRSAEKLEPMDRRYRIASGASRSGRDQPNHGRYQHRQCLYAPREPAGSAGDRGRRDQRRPAGAGDRGQSSASRRGAGHDLAAAGRAPHRDHAGSAGGVCRRGRRWRAAGSSRGASNSDPLGRCIQRHDRGSRGRVGWLDDVPRYDSERGASPCAV